MMYHPMLFMMERKVEYVQGCIEVIIDLSGSPDRQSTDIEAIIVQIPRELYVTRSYHLVISFHNGYRRLPT